MIPPIPLTKDKHGFWETSINLPAWAGYVDAAGPYASPNSDAPSDGTVRISFGNAPEGPTPEQIAAYHYLRETEPFVSGEVIAAIMDKYVRPEKRRPNVLRKHVGLGTVLILPVTKDGHAYIGFECGCSWDNEHGCGVLTHKERVVKVGGADTAFLKWIAEEDARRNP
jgi:hypothetical protein